MCFPKQHCSSNQDKHTPAQTHSLAGQGLSTFLQADRYTQSHTHSDRYFLEGRQVRSVMFVWLTLKVVSRSSSKLWFWLIKGNSLELTTSLTSSSESCRAESASCRKIRVTFVRNIHLLDKQQSRVHGWHPRFVKSFLPMPNNLLLAL